MNRFHQVLSWGIPWLLVLLAFVLPLSTSLVSVLTLVLLVCWLLEGRFQEKWNEVAANPVCLAVFLYVGVLVLGLGWSENVGEGVAVIRKHWKIMVFPVLLTAVRWDWRSRTVGAFIAGVSVVMVLNLLDRAQVFHALGLETFSQTTLLVNHIIFTPMLAFAAYLVAHAVLWNRELKYGRWWLVTLGLLMSCTVFLTKGRMGQLVFFVLLALLIWQYFHRNRWRAALLSLFAFVLIFTVAYTFSPQFQSRINDVRHEIETLSDNPETSVGLRLTWWQNSWVVVQRSPWFGVGTGDYTTAYAAVHQERTPQVSVAEGNPHNQYLYTAIRLGMLGVVSLLAVFLVQLFWGNRSNDGWHRIRVAFPLFFLTIMLTDSYLVSHGSGFLFSLFSAFLYKKPYGSFVQLN
jgi:O-antigen ligase